MTTRRRTDWSALPLHPLLLAAYPAVFLFTLNAAEQLTLEPLWLPLLVSVGGAAAVLLAFWLLMRDVRRAALVTTVLVVGFFGYGHAWNAMADRLDSQWPVIAAWLAAVLVSLFFAWRAGPFVPTATRALNLVAMLLLALNVWGLASAMVAVGAVTPATTDATDLELRPPDSDDLPDVYYVVVDRYAGATALERVYGHDNEPFFAELEERGFVVARHGHANYVKTPLSLVSSLEMEFLDTDELKDEAADGADRTPIHQRLRERLRVPAALKELGYRYLHVGNWWTPTATNVDADRSFVYEGQDEFASALAQTTILRALSDPNAAPEDPWDWPQMRLNNLYALDRLDETTGVAGPKYVFAHLLTTHPPYVHDEDGSFTGRDQVERLGDAESYRRQVVYANSRLLRLIDRIVASDPDAVIVLQADEGPFPARYNADEWGFDWRDATDAELEEKFGILFAMRVPGADLAAEGFHDALTPVNAFRIVFNARFGTDLELLPDRTWTHPDLDHFYDLVEITDRLAR